MKILHTGDWHIGITRWGIDRSEEVFNSLEFIIKIIEEEDIDVILIAGDIFDHRMPKGEDLHRTTEILRRMSKDRRIVIAITGNHDWNDLASGINTFSSLANVHFATNIGIQSYKTRKGESFLVGTFPYIAERNFLYLGREERKEDLGENLKDIINEINERFLPDTVNIFLAHTFIEGAVLGSAMKLSFASHFAFPPSWLPNRAHYIALGHAHKSQRIEGSPAPAYYCGSVIKVDFSEVHDKKKIYIVDATSGGNATIESREIPVKELMEIEFKFSQLETKASLVRDFEGFIKVKVILDIPEMNPISKIKQSIPNCVEVEILQNYETQKATKKIDLTQDPSELFSQYLLLKEGKVEEEVIKVFKDLYMEAVLNADTGH
jgi:exonuclease SbcD